MLSNFGSFTPSPHAEAGILPIAVVLCGDPSSTWEGGECRRGRREREPSVAGQTGVSDQIRQGKMPQKLLVAGI